LDFIEAEEREEEKSFGNNDEAQLLRLFVYKIK
jgi:hypothetical protein